MRSWQQILLNPQVGHTNQALLWHLRIGSHSRRRPLQSPTPSPEKPPMAQKIAALPRKPQPCHLPRCPLLLRGSYALPTRS